MRRVYAYLLSRRGLDRDVVYTFAHRQMIYESAQYHNAVFVGFDQEGVPRHANMRGTGSESTFKGNADSSIPEYSFHWTGRSKYLLLFEAPIDIEFDKDHPYTVAENGNRKVQYANKAELMDGIVKKYHPEALLEGDASGEGGEMAEPKQTEAKNHQPPKSNRSRSRQPKPLPEQADKDGKKGGSQPSEKQMAAEPEPEHVPQEVSDGQT